MITVASKLTQLLGTQFPLVLGPMAGAGGGKLAGEVSAAGAFGFLSGSGYGVTVASFQEELSLAQSALVEQGHFNLPIGVGFLVWQLEQPNSPFVELLRIALDNNVQAIWLSFGSDFPEWIRFIRQYDKGKGKPKTLIFVQISSIQQALTAALEWGVDVIVAQGIESGGHGASNALPVVNLVSSILDAIPPDGPLVLAAGGLANGGHIASMLTLGAEGVVLGTRFLLANESLYNAVQKQALLSAKSDSTLRSLAWDYARQTLGWPVGIDGRGLRNSIVDDFENGVSVQLLQQSLRKGVEMEDADRMIIWAGTGVGQMNEILPAKVIVEQLREDCIQHLAKASQLYSSA
ncbi:CBM1 domain-containing protein [Mycena indigotica]|uniref:CBM1 domain-containing protein n=1 Tax=Mycena indigotica TaxID=2126181 RepID=A0A8H6T244_9AGAR|nr:CBM1 domain-containing protein [Mycena indigotica]KAF7309593.1 CBM1 domain-containing protein [Mycena indigotica]